MARKTSKPAKVYTARQMKAKARRAEAQAAMGHFANLAYGPVAVDYTVNKFGSKVRISHPSETEVAEFFKGRRGFDIYEVLEELGTGFAAQFVRDGLAVESTRIGSLAIYLITTKAAKRFGLPATLANGCPGNYVKVAA